MHSYSQARANAHAALPSNALGCFTLRVTQKVVWEEEGSESHSAPAGQHTPCPSFCLFVLSILFTFKMALFFHSTYNLSVWQSIYQTVWSGEKLCQSEFRSALEVWQGEENLHDAGYALEKVHKLPVAILRMQSNLSVISICVEHITGIWVYIKWFNIPSSFPKGSRIPYVH